MRLSLRHLARAYSCIIPDSISREQIERYLLVLFCKQRLQGHCAELHSVTRIPIRYEPDARDLLRQKGRRIGRKIAGYEKE